MPGDPVTWKALAESHADAAATLRKRLSDKDLDAAIDSPGSHTRPAAVLPSCIPLPAADCCRQQIPHTDGVKNSVPHTASVERVPHTASVERV